MGAKDWADWSFSYTTSYFNPTLKIIALIVVAIGIAIFILARLKFKDFKDLRDVINLLILSSLFLFLGFFFRLLGDFIILWKWLESTFNFIAAIMFMLTAFRFIFKMFQNEKMEFKVDLGFIILICGLVYAIIFWVFLASPSLSNSSLNLEYEGGFLNYTLKLIGSIAYILSTYFLIKGYEKYTEKLGKMIKFSILITFFLFLGSLCRDHGTNLGFTKDYSLKWFQSIFYVIACCFLSYTAYLFYDTGKKFTQALQTK